MSLLTKVRQSLFIVVGCFFILFGVQLLISAYRLNNPFFFVMTFFASNLIILISAALTLGFSIRLFHPSKKEDESGHEEGKGEG